MNVTQNPDIRGLDGPHLKKIFTSTYVGMYSPLSVLTYAINYAWAGLQARVFFVSDLVWHLLNVVIVFFILRQLTASRVAVVVGSAIFAIHPIQVESVAWLSARSTLVYTSFFLLSLSAYIEYIKCQRWYFYALSFVLFAAALLAKSAAITLPVVLLILDFHLRRTWSLRLIWEKLPYFALSLTSGVATLMLRDSTPLSSSNFYGLWDRAVLSGYTQLAYLGKVVLPVGLSAHHGMPEKIDGFLPAEFYGAFAILLCLLVAAIIFRKKLLSGSARLPLVALGLFLVPNIMTTTKIILFGNQLISERYMYLPMIGVALLAGEAVAWGVSRQTSWASTARLVTLLLTFVIGIGYSLMLRDRLAVWQSNLSLWEEVVRVDPKNAFAYYNRGNTKRDLGRAAEALADYDRSIALGFRSHEIYSNRGVVNYELGNFDQAIADLNTSLQISPSFAEVYNYRGAVYFRKGDLKSALSDYNKSIELQPTNLDARFNRALLLKQMGQRAQAIDDLNAILRIDPNYVDALIVRATVRKDMRKGSGACDDYRAYVARGGSGRDFALELACGGR